MASTVAAASTLASYIPEVHEPVHSHSHGRENVQGYLVVRTDWSRGCDDENLRREAIAFFVVEPAFRSGEAKFTNAYGEALDRVHAERAMCGKQQYAIIDSVYDCGCRFFG